MDPDGEDREDQSSRDRSRLPPSSVERRQVEPAGLSSGRCLFQLDPDGGSKADQSNADVTEGAPEPLSGSVRANRGRVPVPSPDAGSGPSGGFQRSARWTR